MAGSILIVDDEATFVDSVVRMLRIEGYDDFTPMVDPTAVPPLLEHKTFDAALLDITMPGMDGIELLEIIRQHSPRTECIMITAHEEVPLVIKAVKRGAYDYLVKPVTPQQLALTLERALEHKRLVEAQAERAELEQQVREAERARKEVEAALTQKMAAMVQLVAGVTHDVNTPLGAVCSTAETLRLALGRLRTALDEDFPGARERSRSLDKTLTAIEQAGKVICSGGERVARIVSRLGTFARLDEAEFKPIDLHRGIEDALALLAHQLPDDIRVTRRYGELPLVPCYPRELNQVFLNLLLNARQAIEGEGEISVATSVEGDRVHVVIRDSGEGISVEHRDRIFEPGFTTRGAGVGTGLGLAICHRIVVGRHLGELQVESREGQGTTVTVSLPTGLRRPER